jgi:hypothetical protein
MVRLFPLKSAALKSGLMVLSVVLMPGQAVAQDSTHKCKIGRPAYCLKYGGTVCDKTNTTNAVGACQAWTNGCFDCHEATSACLGHQIRLRETQVCHTCNTAWLSCMRRNDRRFWPTRGAG